MGWLPKASPFFVFYVLVCLEYYALNVAGNQGSTGDFYVSIYFPGSHANLSNLT